MTALYAVAQMSSDVVLKQRVHAAMVAYAVVVSKEDSSTPNHANRNSLAFNVLNADDDRYAQRFLWAMTTNFTIAGEYAGDQTNVVDDHINFAVGDLWNAVARNDVTS